MWANINNLHIIRLNLILFDEGYDKVADVLILSGADLNAVDEDGFTALYWAAVGGNLHKTVQASTV